jgi:hypothetical protein
MSKHRALIFPFFALFFIGCASLQPSSSRQSAIGSLPWSNFKEANDEAQKIIIGKTTINDLKKLNFDPDLLPNTERILDVRKELLPNTSDTVEMLPPEAKICYLKFVQCEGYKFSVEVIEVKGRGNIALRVIHVRKEDVTTGWELKLNVYLIPRKFLENMAEDDPRKDEKVVAFWLIGGKPNIQEISIKINPLGFFDSISDIGRTLSPVSAPRLDTE